MRTLHKRRCVCGDASDDLFDLVCAPGDVSIRNSISPATSEAPVQCYQQPGLSIILNDGDMRSSASVDDDDDDVIVLFAPMTLWTELTGALSTKSPL